MLGCVCVRGPVNAERGGTSARLCRLTAEERRAPLPPLRPLPQLPPPRRSGRRACITSSVSAGHTQVTTLTGTFGDKRFLSHSAAHQGSLSPRAKREDQFNIRLLAKQTILRGFNDLKELDCLLAVSPVLKQRPGTDWGMCWSP